MPTYRTIFTQISSRTITIWLWRNRFNSKEKATELYPLNGQLIKIIYFCKKKKETIAHLVRSLQRNLLGIGLLQASFSEAGLPNKLFSAAE